MSVLSQNYERLQNASIENKSIVDNYRQSFKDNNITGAHQIANTKPYLVMDAEKLNNLVDTINYMQQFWANDKEKFEGWLRGMMNQPTIYDATKTYNVGEVIYYNNIPYFCIDHNVTGAFNYNKWLLLQLNGMGVNLKGEYNSSTTYDINDVTYIINSNNVEWQYYTGYSQVKIATTYCNIRYLLNESEAYSNEIYMTEVM